MLPPVIPEIVYWIICEKSVIEPQTSWESRRPAVFLTRAIGVDIGENI
jgi:hypothetical protein